MMDWYKNPAVKFEMIKFLKNREFALLVPSYIDGWMKKKSTRMLKCHSVQHLDFILNRIFDVHNKNILFNFYYSLADYKEGIPDQTPNLAERNNDEWNKTYFNHMAGFDWLIDIDAGSHDEIEFAHFSAQEIKALFDKCKVPYELRFSGCGFHFVVQHAFFSSILNPQLNPHKPNNYWQFLTKLSKKLHAEYSEMVDYDINDSRRIVKVPYSLSLYEGKSFICIPFLSDKEFEDFKLENMKPENWVGKIRGRGTHVFNNDAVDCSKLLDELGVEK